MKINIINKNKYKNIPKNKYIINWINIILTKNNTVNINIIITNKKKIKEINKKYRNINKITDILTFKNKNIYNINNTNDIILCAPIIKDIQWKKIILHGILHILKYNHDIITDFKIMNKIENKLGMSGIEPPTTTTSK